MHKKLYKNSIWDFFGKPFVEKIKGKEFPLKQGIESP